MCERGEGHAVARAVEVDERPARVGGLRAGRGPTEGSAANGKRKERSRAHDAMEIGPQDAAAEQRERVANVTDGVAGEGLGVVSTRARTHRGAGLASM